jgi:hypothetical protein
MKMVCKNGGGEGGFKGGNWEEVDYFKINFVYGKK